MQGIWLHYSQQMTEHHMWIYDFDIKHCDMQCRPPVQNRREKWFQCFSIEGIMIGDFLWWVAEQSWANDVCAHARARVRARALVCVCVCVCVCLSVCSSILAHGSRTGDQIGTGKVIFDSVQ